MTRKLKYSTEQVDAVQEYLWTLRDALRLSHWDVFVGAHAAEKGALASVHPCPGRYVAGVRLSRGFWTEVSADEKRSVLTHELLHLTHRDLTEVTRVTLGASGYLPNRAYALLCTQISTEAELMVDHLTTVIAPTMPPWDGPA